MIRAGVRRASWRRDPTNGSTPSRRLAGDPELRRRMGLGRAQGRRGGLLGLGLVRGLRPLDDRAAAIVAVVPLGPGSTNGRPRRPAVGRASSPTPPGSGRPRASNWLATRNEPLYPAAIGPPDSSVASRPRDGCAPARPSSAGHRPACSSRPTGMAGSARSAGGSARIAWRDILLGPDGLPARRMAGGGLRLHRQIRAAPGRLPRRPAGGDPLHQAFPRPRPAGHGPPVVPPRQGAERGQALPASWPRPACPRSGRSRWASSGSGSSSSRITWSRSEIADTIPLDEFVERQLPEWPEPRRSRVRQKLARALGVMTARLHDAGFLHVRTSTPATSWSGSRNPTIAGSGR